MDGIGYYSWTDGKRYLGEYKDNDKDGFGIHKFANGALHQGYWTKGKGNGPGSYQKNPGATVRYGIWENGRQIKWLKQAIK